MEFSTTQRGNDVMLYQGFSYTKYKHKDGETTWRCRLYFSTKCKALLRTRDGNVVGNVPRHCHDSNPQQAQADIIKMKMKNDIKTIGMSVRNVLGSNLMGVSMDVLQHLPKQSSLERSLFRSRASNRVSNPTTTNFSIPENYADIILHDSGVDDSERILAIGDNNLLSQLKNDIIFGDGTFDKAPSTFFQLYTWHAKVGNSYPPCVYFLMKKKDGNTYNRMFTILKDLVPDLMPQQIMLDFDKACMNAAQMAFPQAQIKGCYFHFCQSLIRKINVVGLKTLYESDIDLKLTLKSLSALSFVPTNDVNIIFEELAATFPDGDEFSEILVYFKSTYIEGVSGRPPLFPIPIWNHFDSASTGSLKTTNYCEGFHNSLNSIFPCFFNPSICTLFDGLKRDIGCQKLLLANTQTGRPEAKRRKYENLAAQVSLATQNYSSHPNKLIYLRHLANMQ